MGEIFIFHNQPAAGIDKGKQNIPWWKELDQGAAVRVYIKVRPPLRDESLTIAERRRANLKYYRERVLIIEEYINKQQDVFVDIEKMKIIKNVNSGWLTMSLNPLQLDNLITSNVGELIGVIMRDLKFEADLLRQEIR
jgi:hypothetical protein